MEQGIDWSTEARLQVHQQELQRLRTQRAQLEAEIADRQEAVKQLTESENRMMGVVNEYQGRLNWEQSQGAKPPPTNLEQERLNREERRRLEREAKKEAQAALKAKRAEEAAAKRAKKEAEAHAKGSA